MAQQKALATIEEDVQAFAIAPDNSIAFATQRIKRIKKAYVEHDDFWMGDTEGHHKKIIDGDKFNPTDAQLSYQVESLTWSPDSKRLIVKMDTSEIAQPQGTVVMQMDTQQTVRPNTVLYLMDREGHEIPIKGAKDRTIEGAYNGAWSGDSTTLLYMTKPSGTFGEITTMRPEEGTTKKLFEGITFRALVWDTPRNHAFAIMESLKTLGVPKMVQLDLKNQTIRELFQRGCVSGIFVGVTFGQQTRVFPRWRHAGDPRPDEQTEAGDGARGDWRIRLEQGRAERAAEARRSAADRAICCGWECIAGSSIRSFTVWCFMRFRWRRMGNRWR